ncbi:hypothetical protein [Thauera sinica]|uniref:PqqD family protein n=1 Tax=Thauera sinica TaxID=2665146 RepID=A0ABW1ARC6_9RHOO|nr:hypothetical protein [Thauera sp. K11]
MSSQPGSTSAAAHGIRPLSGRSLCFSPAWTHEGASVVFDRNSGDYWVLDEAARRLASGVAHGAASATIPPASTFPAGDDASPDRLVQSLCDAGILERDDA